MTRSQPDIVVIGAGHNSLIAAAYLAKAGLGVLVLEKNAYAGGGAVSRELTLPGFIHDTHATGVGGLQGSPIVTHDELGLMSRHGLRFSQAPIQKIFLFGDGDSMLLYRDLDQTCEEIAKFSAQDAETYRRTVESVRAMMPVIGMALTRPPISLGNFISMLERVPMGNEMILALTKSQYDVVMERFVHPKVQLALLKMSLIGLTGPEERGTGINMLFKLAAFHHYPHCVVAGGTQNLTDATFACIEAAGGEVRLGATVRRVINTGGEARSVELADGSVVTARKAVIGSIHPHDLGAVVEGLDPGLVARAKATTLSHYASFIVHAALNGPIEWKIGEIANQCSLVELIDSTNVEDFRRMCDASRYGELPSQFTSGINVATNHDSSRAPAGKHTLYSYNYVPFHLKDGGPERWDAIKLEVADWVIEGLSRYANNVGPDLILARTAESPLDFDRYSPSFPGGDSMGIGSYLHQMMGMRPTAELAQYRVPGADGLYLAGPFMHPGGAIIGGGRALAMRMMEDLEMDYSKVMAV